MKIDFLPYPVQILLISLTLHLIGNLNLFADSTQMTFGNASTLSPSTRSILYEYDKKESYLFDDKRLDRTSYPIVQTNISLYSGWYSFHAIIYDGSKIQYSTRGENGRYQNCYGDVCLILTDRNILGISNYATDWSKTSFYNEELFKTKFGNKAAFVITERSVYLYNGYLNEWTRIGLESESVTGVSNKNDLAVIVTSKRIFYFNLVDDVLNEISVIAKPIYRYEIKEDTIECFSYDRVFHYQGKTNQISEFRLDN
ncbi:MAG: hypothetical protein SH817_16735 [Leptospira sp.]|nr:hypothetical protein [Leptospira sp.]